jgi:methylated-DNA-[protein]-cysteine S-methyltransferase
MAQEIAFDLFDTGIGPCGVAWTDRGLVRLQLPESDRPRTIRRLKAKSSATWVRESPPAMVRHAIEEVERHLSGLRPDFSSVELDLTGVASFERDVYAAAGSIAWGRTASYGELAALVGRPSEAREVGQALARNPIAIIIPCHRVLAKGNRIGGFSAHGGTITKERLLALEGVDLEGDAPLLPGLLPGAPVK